MIFFIMLIFKINEEKITNILKEKNGNTQSYSGLSYDAIEKM